MAVNTIIRLPLHVRGDHVLQVIARVVGEPYRLKNFGTPVAFDPELPPCRENPWHVAFDRRHQFGLKVAAAGEDMTFGYMHFQDLTGQAHAWSWHPEDETEACKTLRPGAHATAVAVGQRLIRFFGGSLTRRDTTDRLDLCVDAARARFGPVQPGQTPDDRWYQFHGLLHAEGLLSQVELREAMALMGATDQERALLERLPVTELAPILEKTLPPGTPAGPRARF